jgi:phage N-6-adenine-methyltransferase
MNNDLMFSTGKDDWETPQSFFDELDKEFHFTLDPCATTQTAKCSKYYTKEDDGLSKDWSGETVFINPPYSKKQKGNPGQEAWIKKSYEEGQKPNTICVMLLPARTDTLAFHRYIYHKASEIRFVKGRLRFGGCKDAAPFPSMVVVFKSDK